MSQTKFYCEQQLFSSVRYNSTFFFLFKKKSGYQLKG